MKRIKCFAAVLFSLVLVLNIVGCGNSSDTSSDISSGSSDKREPYNAQDEDVVLGRDFVDTDGDFEFQTVDWEVSNDYVIVIPENDTTAMEQAKKLKNYYSEEKLEIVTDKVSETDKEILLGNTNRKESENSLKEGELMVAVEGKKLVFNSGHSVTLGVAVDKYIRTAPKNGKASVFKLETDFISTALDGYKYVWGDEFEGLDVDFTRWNLEPYMDGTNKVQISKDRNVIDVNDGRLKLHAIRYFDPTNEKIQYRVPYSVTTYKKMGYVYGYAEIRCRLPFFPGVWPSFWAKGTNAGKTIEYKRNTFFAEIDIFEVFGKKLIQPGLIKWYYDGGNAMSINHLDIDFWSWEDNERIETEYHTYGFEWTPEKVEVSVDGKPYYTFDITKSYDSREDMASFHEPMYLIFNNHIITDDSWQEGLLIENNNEKLPACYYIDYIRLYQKDGVGSLSTDYSDGSHRYSDRK